MADFWGSLFGGQNKTLNSDISQTGQQAAFDTGEGQSDISAGDAFLKSILSGDATKQAQALAPQISAAKTSQQQDQKTLAQDGTRSGGTAASSNAAADTTRANLTKLIGQLTGQAATALPSIGTNLTAQGTAATTDQAALAQQRMQNWLNSILGKGITGAVQTAETAGLGAGAGALPGGPGAAAGAQGALSDIL
jgi:hypothetical protein